MFNESFSYIKQYAGNVFNLSKKTINEKEEWCDKFISELRDFYSSNKIFNLEVSNLDQEFLTKYLLEAEEPFQFISVYFAIKEVVIKHNHNISLPILFDASSSGVQHLASLANDLTIAKMVNVVSSEETRNDFYSLAADYVRENILNIKPNNKISEDVKNNLIKIKVNRSILKIPVMTISYNVGLAHMGKDLLQKMGSLVSVNKLVESNVDLEKIKLFDDINKNNINKLFLIKINKEFTTITDDLYITPKEWVLFASIIYKSVFEIAPSIEEVNHYLNNFRALIFKCKIPFVWITPAGMKIRFALGFF